MAFGDYWDRVDSHFRRLSALESRGPIFALEHGLSADEVSEITDELLGKIREWEPRPQDQLWWVIYATEIGYQYAGDQYWQMFEEQTPEWDVRGDRKYIEDAFDWFHRRYRAVCPSGPWARHRSIISWPITHAIVPRDLQEKLARTLYEIRDFFSAEVFEDTSKLGELIASRTTTASSRFREFVESPDLIGRIAGALLQQGDEGDDTPLESKAIARIRGDLEQAVKGRPWLAQAQHAASQRLTIRGGYIGPAAIANIQSAENANEEVQRLGIEPRLVLRPNAARWDVLLELPDMSHLGQRFPDARQTLATSRYTVAGSNGRPQPGGSLVQGRPQRIALVRWPARDEVLIKFDRSDSHLDFLLRTECLLRPVAQWLFRLASDGCAYEVRSMRVRPGQHYFLVSTEPFADCEVGSAIDLACEGVTGRRLDVPSTLTPAWDTSLIQLGLGRTAAVEMWPVGLSPASWDGDTRSEWLSTDTPIFAIQSEHMLDNLSLTLEGGIETQTLTIESVPAGKTCFVALPLLPVGEYSCTLSASSCADAGNLTTSELTIVIGVREASPWTPTMTHNGLFRVESDPAAPTVNDLWEGLRSFDLYGLPDKEVAVTASMFGRQGLVYAKSFRLPAAPVTSKTWTDCFECHVKNDEDALRVIAGVSVCEIAFTAEDAGVFTLRCERDVPPLLWVLRKTESQYHARLQDETDGGRPHVTRYQVNAPTQAEDLDDRPEYEVPAGGGLYVAKLGHHTARLLVPPYQTLDALAPQYATNVALLQRCPEVIEGLRNACQLWGTASLPWQDTVSARQTRMAAARCITAAIAGVLGNYWNGPPDWQTAGELEMLQRWLGEESADIWEDIASKWGRLVSATAIERACIFGELPSMRRRMANRDQDGRVVLLQSALRLLSGPIGSSTWANAGALNHLSTLLSLPVVIRAARYVVLAVDRQSGVTGSVNAIYAGWEWSK